MGNKLNQLLDEKHIEALIFDLDGVVTKTAETHAQAWKKMLDEYLLKREQSDSKPYEPMDINSDYKKLIDGIPRYDGVRNFLNSRGIYLPEGNSSDAPGSETIAGLGNLKNEYFQKLIRKGGVAVYDDTINWLNSQLEKGRKTAIISASKNCKSILEAANLEHLFKVRIDGVSAEKLNLNGKPAPDIFLEAAKALGFPKSKVAIFEDALAGVQAGKKGNFALVVGVNRSGKENALIKEGADIEIDKFPN